MCHDAARFRLRRDDHRRLCRAASALYPPGPLQAGAARGEAARRGPVAARGVVPGSERGAADRLDCRRARSRRAHHRGRRASPELRLARARHGCPAAAHRLRRRHGRIASTSALVRRCRRDPPPPRRGHATGSSSAGASSARSSQPRPRSRAATSASSWPRTSCSSGPSAARSAPGSRCVCAGAACASARARASNPSCARTMRCACGWPTGAS